MAVRCLKCMKEHEEGISKCPFCGFVEGAQEDEQCYLPPRTVLKGRYMIGSCLGSGGFGVTYVAWDSLLEKKVAIKEYLPSELATRTIGQTRVTLHDSDCLEKYQQGKRSFLEESRRLAKFNSVKGVVSIFDCFDENDTAYLVMECLEGKTLQQMINERKRLPFKEVLPIFVDVLEALEVVHAAGMMHRDIAPDNIFVCNDGTAKLIDFGAARFMTTTHSRSLSMILKIGYAPIEQYTKHGNQGPWTDIYAVAASLYHAVTGIVPPDSYDRVEEDKLKRPGLLARRLPKHAETAMLNALNIIETNRTSSAKQFAEELSGDLDVSRIREKIQREDTGRIAKWMKYAAVGFAAAIVLFAVLYVSTGGSLFRPADYDIPNGMSRVPYVINDIVSDADAKMKEEQLHMVIGDRITDTYFDNNFVLMQNPRSGNIAYVGSVVNVTASMKPDEYFVPDLSNYSREYAVQVLEAAGFTVVVEEGESDTAAPGAVIDQQPPGNTIVFEGSEIRITINKGERKEMEVGKLLTMPDYLGMQFEKAQEAALQKHLYMVITRGEYSDDIPRGEIIEQLPASGESAYSGSTVNVTVSLGKRTIIVPNLIYLSEEAALEKVENRLLTANIKYVEDLAVQEGLVLAQLPDPGKSIYENGEMTLYVSSGFKVKVPEVTGIPVEDAQTLLSGSRLGYAVVLENSDTVPEGQVMEQSVKAGESVAQGTIITLTVSAGKRVINVTGVTLSASGVTLEYGEVYTLAASVLPQNATTTGVTWSSSNSSVASVSSVGVVRANGVGSATITVTTKDGGYTAQCTVTVVKVLSSLSIDSKPTKAAYFLNEAVDYSGLVVTAIYSDGSTEDVTGACTKGGLDSSSPGTKNIAVSYTYNGESRSQSFSVHVRALTGISASSLPKQDYKIGESESLAGLAITASYDDGATRPINLSACTVSGFSSESYGNKTINVSYTEGYTTVRTEYQIIVHGSLQISQTNVLLDNGQSITLTVSCLDDAGADLSQTRWVSDNSGAVSVSGNGSSCVITGVDAGKATITATNDKYGAASASVGAYGAEVIGYNERPDEGVYEIRHEWTEYRFQTRTNSMVSTSKDSTSENTTLDGWEKYGTDDNSGWVKSGGVQGPVDWDPGNSDTRKTVNNEKVLVSGEWTETIREAWTETITPAYDEHTGYSYWTYRKIVNGKDSGSACCTCALEGNYEKVMRTKTTTVAGRLKYAGTTTCYCGANVNVSVYTETGSKSGQVWWFGDSPTYKHYDAVTKYHPAETKYHPAVYKTVYYYQDYVWNASFKHYFYKWNGWTEWSSWSEWSESPVTSGNNVTGGIPNQVQTDTNVEQRQCYSYRKKP